jgi:hypothetical protein
MEWFGGASRVNCWGIALMLAGLTANAAAGWISGRFDDARRARAYWAARVAGTAVVILGAVIAMKLI